MKHEILFYILGKFYMQGKMIIYKWENDYKHHLAAWEEYTVLRGRKSLITWSTQWIRMLQK